MVVQRDDSQSFGRAFLERCQRARQGLVVQRASLVSPGTDGVQADDDDTFGDVHGLRRSEDVLPVGEGPGEARRERVGDVVVSWNGQKWQAESAEEGRRCLQLLPPAAVRHVSRGDEQGRLEVGDQLTECGQRLPGLPVAHVQIGKVENARCHGRGAGYTLTSRAPTVLGIASGVVASCR